MCTLCLRARGRRASVLRPRARKQHVNILTPSSTARLDDYVEVPHLIKMFNKLSYFLFVIYLLCFVLVYSIY